MIAFALTLLCAAQQPAPTPEVEQRVQAYLGTIDTPIPDAAWQRLGPGAATMLERIAQDTDELPTRRAKAVHGLSVIGSPTAPDTILSLAKDEKQPLVVRLAAVYGAERVVPQGQLVAQLTPVLRGASDGQVRKAAADVLAHNGGCAAVREQARRETQAVWMSRAVEKCAE